MPASDNAKRLKSLRSRAIGLRELARLIGWDASRYQYYEDTYKKAYLPRELVERIKPHVVGRGEPPVTAAEIDALCGQVPPLSYSEQKMIEAPLRLPLRSALVRDLPIRGTVSGGPGGFSQMANGDVTEWAFRPEGLKGRTDVFGLWVEDHSMVPAHRHGSLIVVDPRRPPLIGDDVVIELKPESARDEQRAILKHLVGRNATVIRVEQYNPAKTFEIPLKQIIHLYRVMPLADLLAG